MVHTYTARRQQVMTGEIAPVGGAKYSDWTRICLESMERTEPEHMGVSIHGDTPKSSIFIGFFITKTIHFGVPPFMETPIYS